MTTRVQKISAMLLGIISPTILMSATTTYSAPGPETEAAAAVNAFAIDLYKQIRKPGENLIFSPYSISVCLAMAYAGARGKTNLKWPRHCISTWGSQRPAKRWAVSTQGSLCRTGEKCRNKCRQCAVGGAIVPAAEGIRRIGSGRFSERAS